MLHVYHRPFNLFWLPKRSDIFKPLTKALISGRKKKAATASAASGSYMSAFQLCTCAAFFSFFPKLPLGAYCFRDASLSSSVLLKGFTSFGFSWINLDSFQWVIHLAVIFFVVVRGTSRWKDSFPSCAVRTHAVSAAASATRISGCNQRQTPQICTFSLKQNWNLEHRLLSCCYNLRCHCLRCLFFFYPGLLCYFEKLYFNFPNEMCMITGERETRGALITL